MKLDLIGEEQIKKYMESSNKYFIVNIISKRARALIEGEKPLVDPAGAIRPSEIALKELANGKLKVTPKTTRNKMVDIVRKVSEHS
jgi:DNA-directed RNA polymerase subunit K/omega